MDELNMPPQKKKAFMTAHLKILNEILASSESPDEMCIHRKERHKNFIEEREHLKVELDALMWCEVTPEEYQEAEAELREELTQAVRGAEKDMLKKAKAEGRLEREEVYLVPRKGNHGEDFPKNAGWAYRT